MTPKVFAADIVPALPLRENAAADRAVFLEINLIMERLGVRKDSQKADPPFPVVFMNGGSAEQWT